MTDQQKSSGEESRTFADHTPLPWRVEDAALTIAADDGTHGRMHVADIRGWGHLTGRGARALPSEQAMAIQTANANLIVDAVNSHASNLARIEELEKALKIADELVAFHRDYSTMPADDFKAKYGFFGGHSTEKFSRLRADYVEARSALTAQQCISPDREGGK